jgi:hypothetical protein
MPLRIEAVLASAASIAPASIMAALIAEPMCGEVWLLASVPLRSVPLAITTALNADITPTHPASKGHKPPVQRRELPHALLAALVRPGAGR